MSVKFSEKEIRFLRHMRVGRLATTDGEAIHLVSPDMSRARRGGLLHGHARENP